MYQRRAIGLTLLLVLATMSVAATRGQSGPDRQLLVGATIVDGTGSIAYRGDVLLEGDRIAAIGTSGSLHPSDSEGALAVIDLAGLVLAPGFIDIHNHSTESLKDDALAMTQVAQGITTIMVGADGSSPWPIGEYLDGIDALSTALNVGTLVGHGTVRRGVLEDDYRRTSSASEITDMALRVRQGMTDGAFGLSSGLEYDPGYYSTTEELIELARVAGSFGGFYMSHVRDEEDGILDSIDEALRIGVEGRLPVQISHIKTGNAAVWGQAPEMLRRLAAARVAGLDVTADQYPYTAWQSGLGIVVPSRRFDDPVAVAEGLAAVGGGSRLQIVGYDADPTAHGMRLSEIAARDGKTEVEMYIEMMANGGSRIIGHTMSQEDVDTFMTSPMVMTSSDGGVGNSHPRGAGTFVRILGHYLREREMLSLEQAVHRGTGMPARRLGLRDRGVIRPGAMADLVAFDAATVTDHSTFTDPLQPATGVHATWVSGQRVWADGRTTGARPGRALRHRAR
ncbi:MAG TPA: D-aminoacylase [Acidobacteriota bacterium]|nr:D-aminoacylase [Acidobacteriota bacterium]